MLDQKIQGLYAITPNKNLDIALIEGVITKHQVNILQYRHKTDNEQRRLDEASQLRELCLTHNTLFIINDDINLCEKVGANGVHLGQNDASIQTARAQLGKDSIIGVSCYNQLGLAIQAQSQGANYVAFGALFASSTKPNAKRCPLSVVTQAKKELCLPIVGIGGITFENQQLALDAGCDTVAMINELFN
ncbi:MAG TPA: thiamine phosphate synthase [Candidatus Thioglobus sp.]|jgi:thiamine-phosphate pyrophosphorylase|nr:thiamine phosphate synthase [Candidatus Thioglobus sp.]HIL20672.1 thiamine phosphate synthase [Candidatus Thioglobus sp.]